MHEHLSSVGVDDPETLPSVSGDELRRRLGDGPIVTDDHPLVEHWGAGLSGGDTAGAAAAFRRRMLGTAASAPEAGLFDRP